MMFCEKSIGEIADVTKLAGFEFTKYIKYNETGEIIALRALNLRNGELDLSDIKRIDRSVSEGLTRSKLYKNDILLTYTGNGYGDCAIIEENNKYHLAPNICKIVPNLELVDPYFLYSYIRSNDFYKQMSSNMTGSGQPTIPMKTIRTLKVPVPQMEIQKKIASIIQAINLKLRTNRAINENLAVLLQTVYQERFGDVDIAAKQGVLSDICSYSKDRVAVSELDVTTYFSTENMLPRKAGSSDATSLPTTLQTTACHKGDTLISNIRPYFKKIVYCEDECGCSTDVLCFTPNQPQYSAYLFSTLYADKFFAFMVAGAKGTKMPRGDKQQIMTYPIVFPSEVALVEFNTIALPLIKQIYSNRAENKRLSLLRDTLLPKLMSGELDVSDIDL